VAGIDHLRHRDHDGWRLPTRLELRSLVSHRTRDPALPEDHPFQNVSLGWYWSSTTAARNADYAWCLQTTGGRVFFDFKEHLAFAWPCRGRSTVLAETGDPAEPPVGVPWPSPRFQVLGEVVRDRLTHLLWSRSADLSISPVDWPDALDRVAAANRRRLAGIAAWRLPTINELESLVDAGRHDPSLPPDHPFEGVGQGYWSSTSSAFEPNWAMVLHLGRGAVGVGIKVDPRFLVWPVSSDGGP
jgi:hypothetical protein